MWEQRIKCVQCNNFLKIREVDTSITCERCEQKYNTIDDELYHATASSGTCVFYEVDNNFCIRRIYFHNQPLDLLDEAVQNTKLIYSGEKNPYALSSIARKYHDALKKRLQVFLALKHIPNLTRAQKEKIEGDMPTYSILNLMNFLKKAFPSEQTKIQNFLNKHETIIKRVKWVRDKSEHPLMQLWSMPGKIYEDRNEQPNSTKPPKDHLLYNFIIGVNNAVIDIYILLLDLDPVSRDEEQYKILNDFRVVS